MFFYFTIFLVKLLTISSIIASHVPPKNRIVGGDDAEIENFPYQVSVINIDTAYWCGGIIIHPKYVLSAAHCFLRANAESLLVRAGSSYIYEDGQVVDVSLIIQHSSYDETTFDYDLSVLKLATNLQYGTAVQAIQLPAAGSVFEGSVAVATGWGRLGENGSVPYQLQQVQLPLISRKNCTLFIGDKFTERMICAGYLEGGKDTCKGDSGGPLAVNGVLVGVTSWGDGCAQSKKPGVYTQVSYFRDYIDNIINN